MSIKSESLYIVGVEYGDCLLAKRKIDFLWMGDTYAYTTMNSFIIWNYIGFFIWNNAKLSQDCIRDGGHI